MENRLSRAVTAITDIQLSASTEPRSTQDFVKTCHAALKIGMPSEQATPITIRIWLRTILQQCQPRFSILDIQPMLDSTHLHSRDIYNLTCYNRLSKPRHHHETSQPCFKGCEGFDEFWSVGVKPTFWSFGVDTGLLRAELWRAGWRGEGEEVEVVEEFLWANRVVADEGMPRPSNNPHRYYGYNECRQFEERFFTGENGNLNQKPGIRFSSHLPFSDSGATPVRGAQIPQATNSQVSGLRLRRRPKNTKQYSTSTVARETSVSKTTATEFPFILQVARHSNPRITWPLESQQKKPPPKPRLTTVELAYQDSSTSMLPIPHLPPPTDWRRTHSSNYMRSMLCTLQISCENDEWKNFRLTGNQLRNLVQAKEIGLLASYIEVNMPLTCRRWLLLGEGELGRGLVMRGGIGGGEGGGGLGRCLAVFMEFLILATWRGRPVQKSSTMFSAIDGTLMEIFGIGGDRNQALYCEQAMYLKTR